MAGVNVNFQLKSSKKIPLIPGTRNCVGRSQTIISSGIVSLDGLLGGGIPLRDIVLIEEDEFGFYAQLLIKYFISEGIVCGHSGFLASLDLNTNKLVSELPAVVQRNALSSERQDTAGCSSDSPGDLKIAWRYHDTPLVQSAPTSVFGHQFDLAGRMEEDMVNNAELFHWKHQGVGDSCPYNELLNVLNERLNKGGHNLLDNNKQLRRTALRIVIHSAGSPLWGSPFNLPMFFYKLRLLVSNSLSVCLITLPTRIIQAAIIAASSVENCTFDVISRSQHLSDWSLRLESLANNDDPAFSEYNGLIYLNKVSSKNRLAPYVPVTMDWAFKLRKKRFIIEKLHLPPDLGESVQREQDESASFGCANTLSNKCDF